MTVSSNFEFSADMQQTLITRRKNDEALIEGWIAKLPALERLLSNFEKTQSDEFKFTVESKFETAVPAAAKAADFTYAEPTLHKVITFTKGAETSSADIKLNLNGVYSFTAEGNTFNGTVRTQLLQCVEQWVEGLDSQYRMLNIAARVQRADATQSTPKEKVTPKSV